jgi:Rrf2 family protein
MAPPEEVMKFTSSCAHAPRALVFLAKHERDGLVASHAIAEAEGLPELFLLKVLRPLASAGVLFSMKGPNGGYHLARPARRISLLDVAEAVGDPVRGDVPRFGADGKLDACLQEVCDAGAELVRAKLRRVSVADLAGEG